MEEEEIKVPKSKVEQYKCLLFDREKKTVLTKNKDSWLSIVMGTLLILLIFAALYRGIREVQFENEDKSARIFITIRPDTRVVINQHGTEKQSSLQHPNHQFLTNDYITDVNLNVRNAYENAVNEQKLDSYIRNKRSAPRHRMTQKKKKVGVRKNKAVNKKPRKVSSAKTTLRKHERKSEKKQQTGGYKRHKNSKAPQRHKRSVQKLVETKISNHNNATNKTKGNDATLFQPISLQKISKRSTNVQKIKKNKKHDTLHNNSTKKPEFQHLNDKKHYKSSIDLNDPKILREFVGDTIQRIIRFVNNESFQRNSIQNEIISTRENEIKLNNTKKINSSIVNKTTSLRKPNDLKQLKLQGIPAKKFRKVSEIFYLKQIDSSILNQLEVGAVWTRLNHKPKPHNRKIHTRRKIMKRRNFQFAKATSTTTAMNTGMWIEEVFNTTIGNTL